MYVNDYIYLDSQVESIIQNFDFDKIQKVMSLMDWHWYTKNGFRVPSLEEIKSTAARLLSEALHYAKNSESPAIFSCGDFKAEVDLAKEVIELSFIVESLSNYE